MRIQFIEVENFRKLRSVRIDLSEKTTLFLGANNSGKTSAMLALSHFLVDKTRFTTNDFTLCNWATIEKVASDWEGKAKEKPDEKPTVNDIALALPCLDLWLHVESSEIHHARELLPTLDWNGGLLGVRLRFEPDDIEALHKQ